MSHSSYTASERRGIIIIGLIALLIIGWGVGVSFCSRGNGVESPPYPEVEERSDLVDSIYMKEKEVSTSSKNNNKEKRESKSSKSKKSSKPTKSKKTYRKRSPLDEPV
ncbi:MAG: hypothetical protein J1D77_06880 [Muribaculaceae bacterium]|nr:hypothetical protein [Muribaculaceae bacterium]